MNINIRILLVAISSILLLGGGTITTPINAQSFPTVAPTHSPTNSPSGIDSPSVTSNPSSAIPSIMVSMSPSSSPFLFSPCEDPDNIEVKVEIVTDRYPSETSWALRDDEGNYITGSGPYDSEFSAYDHTFCVNPNICHMFTIFDTFGDGIEEGGSYKVYYDGEIIKEGGGEGEAEWKYSESTYLNDLCPSETPSTSPAPTPVIPTCPANRFCYEEGSNCAEEGLFVLSPLSGSTLGGTILKLENRESEIGEVDEAVLFFCRFQGASHEEIIPAYWDLNRIYCPTPFWGQDEDVTVTATDTQPEYEYRDDESRIAIPCTFDPDVAYWFKFGTFQYIGDETSVKVSDTGTSPLITSGDTIEVQWSANSLLLSALAHPVSSPIPTSSPTLIPTRDGSDVEAVRRLSVTEDDILVDVEVLALNTGAIADPLTPTFEKIQNMTLSNPLANTIDLTIDTDSMGEFLIDDWGIEGSSVGVVLVRVVAYHLSNTTYGTIHTLATKTSNLIGVLSRDSRRFLQDLDDGEKCPIIPRSECFDESDTVICPPTYLLAESDNDFEPDSSCEWPLGENACDPTFALVEDLYLTCRYYASADTPSSFIEDYCSGVDLESPPVGGDGCACSTYHDGAKGCMKSGSTTCCYSTTGALITDVSDGAGTISCVHRDNDDSFNEQIDKILFDVLPFLFCCVSTDTCDDYYNERASISDEDYEFLDDGIVAFGDPHLVTFDGLHFDFNGAGEYILYCATEDDDEELFGVDSKCHPNSDRLNSRRGILSVHAQFTPLEASQRGTSMTAIAIEHPLYENGQKPIVITNDLKVYVGNVELTFPDTTKELTKRDLVGKDIEILRTTDLSKDRIIFRVKMPEIQLKVVAVQRILTPTLLQRKKKKNVRSVGLSGVAGDRRQRFLREEVDTAILFNSVGNATNIEFITNKEQDMVVTDPKQIKKIYTEFGTTWEIGNESASLFGVLNNFHDVNIDIDTDFNTFYDDEDNNTVVTRGRKLVTYEEAEALCSDIAAKADVKKAIIKAACIYDAMITNNVTIVAATLEVALEELKELETIINNQPPQIVGGRNQTISVEPNQRSIIEIEAFDEDGQILSASFERNDDNLFELSSPSDNKFVLEFMGATQIGGTFKAQVTISDGLTPVIFTATAAIEMKMDGSGSKSQDDGQKKKKGKKNVVLYIVIPLVSLVCILFMMVLLSKKYPDTMKKLLCK